MRTFYSWLPRDCTLFLTVFFTKKGQCGHGISLRIAQMFSSRFMRWNGLNSALANSNHFFTEDILMIFLFYSNQLSISQNFMHILIHVILICLFHLNKKKTGKLSFLDVEEISRQQGKFLTTVYRKPTFNGVYTHFDSFLSMSYKFGMTYTLAYRSFNCSNWTEFDEKM